MELRFCECGRPIPSKFPNKKSCCRACKLRKNREKCGSPAEPKIFRRKCLVCGADIVSLSPRKTCDDVCEEVAKFCRHQRIPLRDEPGHVPFDKDLLRPGMWGPYVIRHGANACRF
jgi:hypothetical protein